MVRPFTSQVPDSVSLPFLGDLIFLTLNREKSIVEAGTKLC